MLNEREGERERVEVVWGSRSSSSSRTAAADALIYRPQIDVDKSSRRVEYKE